jgi:phytol kinase
MRHTYRKIHMTRFASLDGGLRPTRHGEPREEGIVDPMLGVVILLGYYLVTLFAVPLALRAYTAAPREVVRKLQHVAYALSIFLLLGLFERWYVAVGAASLLVIVAFPVLALWERHPSYQRLLTDRSSRGGDLRRQMLFAQLAFALLIAVFWGGLGPSWKPLIAAAVMVWGFGDAAAALIGRFLGRRRIVHRAVDGAKTVEGTAAMIAAAAAATALTLSWYGGESWWASLAAAALVAPVAGVIELFSRRGLDTLTVPLSTAAALLPLLLLTSALGW